MCVCDWCEETLNWRIFFLILPNNWNCVISINVASWLLGNYLLKNEEVWLIVVQQSLKENPTLEFLKIFGLWVSGPSVLFLSFNYSIVCLFFVNYAIFSNEINYLLADLQICILFLKVCLQCCVDIFLFMLTMIPQQQWIEFYTLPWNSQWHFRNSVVTSLVACWTEIIKKEQHWILLKHIHGCCHHKAL